MTEGPVEEKKPMIRRHWKPILLASVISLILVGSLVYYVLTEIVNPPLRIDSVPAGAYVVPWMQPSPPIDVFNQFASSWHDEPWNPDMVMASALKLNMTFSIATPNGTRIIPSTVYLGHDTQYLYIAGRFRAMYRNPNAGKGDEIPQYFALYFDADNDGRLIFPESGSRFVAEFAEDGWHPSAAWSCDDMIWSQDPTRSYLGSWVSAEYYYSGLKDRLPTPATLNNTWGYDNSTGTWIILFSRYLLGSGDSHTNAFIMRSGERWVVGFSLEFGFLSRADYWPDRTYYYISNDVSWWPKLVIDLTNPPSWLAP